MKVLVFDDNHADFLHILSLYGTKEGIEFVGAETAKEAEDLLKGETFDALLLDGNLDYDGLVPTGPAILQPWIKSGLCLPPVFMISGDSTLNAEGVNAGATGIIGKTDLWDIPSRLKELLK